ncbi:MAG: hypothetical protein H7301_05130 [Cryobacterium sp.]|nr:hypothetical protein [Oligoflexia bacterium]
MTAPFDNSDFKKLSGSLLHLRRKELYDRYLSFIQSANQKDRRDVNRRIRSVFVWCFLVPVVVVSLVIYLVNRGVLPRSFRSHQDWILLFFPVLYSLYFFSSQVLTGIPAAFRKGGVGLTLSQAAQEAEWRIETCEGMERELAYLPDEWSWVITNIEEDLERLQMRIRHLTALAGAVFFLLMQGIDSLTNDGPTSEVFAPGLSGGASSSEWVGLALFLFLLYVSGQQNIQVMRRFLGCVRLVKKHAEP